MNRRIVIHSGLGMKGDPILKITKAKRTGRVAQVLE
jgi:hypothetical protein